MRIFSAALPLYRLYAYVLSGTAAICFFEGGGKNMSLAALPLLCSGLFLAALPLMIMSSAKLGGGSCLFTFTSRAPKVFVSQKQHAGIVSEVLSQKKHVCTHVF